MNAWQVGEFLKGAIPEELRAKMEEAEAQQAADPVDEGEEDDERPALEIVHESKGDRK